MPNLYENPPPINPNFYTMIWISFDPSEPLGGPVNTHRLLNEVLNFNHNITVWVDSAKLNSEAWRKINILKKITTPEGGGINFKSLRYIPYELEYLKKSLRSVKNASIQQDIINQKQLYHLAIYEIEQAFKDKQIGNLAGASDLLRSLTPILFPMEKGKYICRIYKDIDNLPQPHNDADSFKIPDFLVVGNPTVKGLCFAQSVLAFPNPFHPVLKQYRQLQLTNYTNPEKLLFLGDIKEANKIALPYEFTVHRKHHEYTDVWQFRRAVRDYLQSHAKNFLVDYSHFILNDGWERHGNIRVPVIDYLVKNKTELSLAPEDVTSLNPKNNLLLGGQADTSWTPMGIAYFAEDNCKFKKTPAYIELQKLKLVTPTPAISYSLFKYNNADTEISTKSTATPPTSNCCVIQ